MADLTFLTLALSKVADVKTSIFLVIASGFTLFIPDDLAQTLGLAAMREEYVIFFGLGFVLSIAYLLTSILYGSWVTIQACYSERQYFKVRRKYLIDMTEEEREILRFYMHEGKSKVRYPVSDGAICLLEQKDIVMRASDVASRGDVFDYVLQPWARTELKEHPEYLDILSIVRPNTKINVVMPK